MEKRIVTIQGGEIDSLVNLFNDRGTNFYHACQFSEFESYLESQGVTPPRLAGKSRPAPASQTAGEAAGDCWTDSLIHLSPIDLGQAYAQDTANLPNPRGPISIQFLPAALRQASEVGICLRAMDAEDAQIEREMFLGLKDVPYLFRYTAEAPLPEKTYLKSAEAIEKEFGVKDVQCPELFCRFTDNRLPLEFINKILVDHYPLYNREFRDWMFEPQFRHQTGFLIERRYCPADIGGHLLKAVAKILENAVPPLEELALSSNPKVSQWAQALIEKGQHARYSRYARALRRDTLLPLKALSERYFSQLRNPAVQPRKAHPPIHAQTRQLIKKLLAENIPPESIARIVDIPLADLNRYLQQTGRN